MKTFIQLGRTGDILAVLPMLYHEHTQGNRCALMVAKEYRALLDGCSYLEPIQFQGEVWNLPAAFDLASQQNGSDIVVTQVNGPLEWIQKYAYERNGQTTAVTDSFVKESWKLAGKLDLWKTQPPLVFDKRNREREAALINKHVPENIPTKKGKPKKLLVVSLGGNTAPFPYSDLLWELLYLKLNDWRVLDLSSVKAESFYDLLGIYEIADALLASDSAPLHLAHAVKKLPVLALVNDKPNYWHGAPWRTNHVFHCRYEDFARKALEIFDQLELIGETGHWDFTPKAEHETFLCWNRSEERGEPTEHKAQQTWSKFDVMLVPIETGAVGKDSTRIGDDERHPFLRSALQLALMRLRPQDNLVLVRANTCLEKHWNPGCPFPEYSHRYQEDRLFHPAIDYFSAPKTFWERIFPEIPDLIMGRDHVWCRVLMELFKAHGAVEVTGVCWNESQPRKPKMLRPGENPAPRLTYQLQHANSWLSERGLGDLFPAIGKQAETVPLNPASLPANAYNPSILRRKDKIWATFRFHTGNWPTRLGIGELEPHGNLVRFGPLDIPGISVEDAKFFTYLHQPWLSWVESNWEGQAEPKCVIKIGRLTEDWQVTEIQQPNFRKNDWSGMEKNWCFFESKGRMFAVYHTYGTQEVLAVLEDTHYETEGADWTWGRIKGGVIAGLHEGKLLRFFHSTLDNEDPPWRRRYYVGALLMDPEPPFAIRKVSRKPILYGSSDDDLTQDERLGIFHYKGRVVFPGGVVRLNDGWLLAVGINDCRCGLVKITNLNL